MTSRSLTFGRGPGADVTISGDEYVSPVHCRITYRAGRYWVEDLGSTNGTWIVNPAHAPRRAWTSIPLKPGDKVRIGRTTLPWEAQ